jgi:membrane protein YdbS with pleckstrin-like domain
MRAPGHGRAHNQALRRAVNRLIAVIPAPIVLIVAVSMGIGAVLLGYPVWAIPLIAVFGAGGGIVAIRVFG